MFPAIWWALGSLSRDAPAHYGFNRHEPRLTISIARSA
jgi:hypothetical protein